MRRNGAPGLDGYADGEGGIADFYGLSIETDEISDENGCDELNLVHRYGYQFFVGLLVMIGGSRMDTVIVPAVDSSRVLTVNRIIIIGNKITKKGLSRAN